MYKVLLLAVLSLSFSVAHAQNYPGPGTPGQGTGTTDERLVSRQVDVRLGGGAGPGSPGRTTSVLSLLGLQNQREYITSVIVIASSERGYGQLLTWVNGRQGNSLVDQRTLSQSLQPSQIAVQGYINGDIRDIVFEARGNVTLTWVGVTLAGGYVQPGPGPGPGPGPQPQPRFDYNFQGSFEQTQVTFSGANPDQVAQSCIRFMGSNSGRIDDIQIFGVSYHKNEGYWSNDQLCAIVALNSKVQNRYGDEVVATGVLENTPFRIEASPRVDLEQLIRTWVPRAVADSRVDDITINGVSYHKNQGYWYSRSLVAIIVSLTAPVRSSVVARGNFEATPFVFQGFQAEDIRRQCLNFWGEVGSDMESVDDIIVNNVSRHNSSGYWNAESACMMVTAMASTGERPGPGGR